MEIKDRRYDSPPRPGFMKLVHEGGVIKTIDANGNESDLGGDVLAALEADPEAARDAIGLRTGIYYDDWKRADTADNDLGTSPSGHTYFIGGSGEANVRILDGAVTVIDPGGSAYIYPQLPEDFGTIRFMGIEFSCLDNGSQVGGVTITMLMASAANSLAPFRLHLPMSEIGGQVEVWTGAGAETAVDLGAFSLIPRRDGTKYRVWVEFRPATEELVLYLPDRASVTFTHADLANVTRFVAWEIQQDATSAYKASISKSWAIADSVAIDLVGKASAAMASDGLLQGIPRVLFHQGAVANTSGATGNQLLATFQIPPGAMGPNGFLRVTGQMRCANTATVGTRVVTVGVGGSGFNKSWGSIATQGVCIPFQWVVTNRNSQSSQVISGAQSRPTESYEDHNTSGNNYTFAIDTSVVNTFSVSASPIDAADVLSLDFLTVESVYLP